MSDPNFDPSSFQSVTATILAEVRMLNGNMAEFKRDQDARIQKISDLENRIASLEQFKTAFSWVAAVFSLLFGWAISLIAGWMSK